MTARGPFLQSNNMCPVTGQRVVNLLYVTIAQISARSQNLNAPSSGLRTHSGASSGAISSSLSSSSDAVQGKRFLLSGFLSFGWMCVCMSVRPPVDARARDHFQDEHISRQQRRSRRRDCDPVARPRRPLATASIPPIGALLSLSLSPHFPSIFHHRIRRSIKKYVGL